MPMTNFLFLGIRHPTFPYNFFSIIKQVLHQQQPYMDVHVQGVYCVFFSTTCSLSGWDAGRPGIWSGRYRNEKNADAGTSPVPEYETRVPVPVVISFKPMPSASASMLMPSYMCATD
jgi:hypothetical protein